MLSGRVSNCSEGEGEDRSQLLTPHLVGVEVQVATHVKVSDAIGKGAQLE